MPPRTPPLRGLLPYLGLSLAAFVAVIGAVMADSHQPVAIEPDAPRAGGAQVATFALG